MRYACLILTLLVPLCAHCSEATDAADNSFQKADAELNTVYEKVIRLLDSKISNASGNKNDRANLANKNAKADLVKAQRAWITFRENEAAARAGVTSQGGSAYAMDYQANMAETTRQRIVQLEIMLRNLE